MIAPMIALMLAGGVQPRITAAGDPPAKASKQSGYTLTQLDTGINSASVVQHLSENGVAIGDVLAPEFKSFAWSAQTGLVLLTLGGSQSVATAVSRNGIVTGASATTGDASVRGFVWTVPVGIAEIGNLGGDFTIPQSVNSSGVIVGDSLTNNDKSRAFMWTKKDGIVDLVPDADDASARWVTDEGLVVGTIYTETTEQIFIWTEQNGLETIRALSNAMRPDYVNSHGDLAGPYFNEDGSAGTFFWSRTTGLIDIGTLGGTEIYPTALSETGTVVGFGTTATGEAHAFVWSGPGTLTDLGTLGGDFSFANAVNSSGLVVGYSKTASGPEHAFAWTAAGGLVDLGTLGGAESSANFVTDSGTIVGTSEANGHQGTHAFVWTANTGMIEMSSLGGFDAVWAMSANGLFAGFSSGRKSVEDQHAVLWAPPTPGSGR